MLDLLNSYGITKTNRWIKFNGVYVIYMNQDANIMIDDNYIFYIDTGNELLYLSKSHKYKEMNSFKTALSAYPIECVLPFDSVSGLISTTMY